jgi:hypothetical protein
VKQHPEYLRNQSRWLHARYRRNKAWRNGFVVIWLTVWGVLFCCAAFDRITGARWGLSSYLLDLGLFFAFGLVAWVAQTLIAEIMLAYIRHTFGPEPIDEN